MSPAATSLFAFSFYEIIAGMLFLFIPNQVLGLLKIPKTDEIWIRFVGIFAMIAGFYNYQIATLELEEMYCATMYTRGAFMLFIIAVVVFKKQPRVLLLFGLMDLIAMAWTYSTM